MRIALVYDCLYPNTVGGAERWLRALAERLAPDHEVTYVTRRQWERGDEPGIEGVEVVAVSGGGPLYDAAGRRRLGPLLRFGLGVIAHFARRRGRYDVVHCVSYPYTGLVGLRVALAGRRPRLFVEWIECLTNEYWRAYAGAIGGLAGRVLQALCVRLTPAAFCFSAHTEERLRAAGYRGPLERLGGLWLGERTAAPAERVPLVLFAGRHVEDKGVRLLPDALAPLLRRDVGLRAVLVGDGPQRADVVRRIGELGLSDRVSVPGFVERTELDGLLARASCVVAPSARDGYGMVVAEAAAAGAPVVVCRAPDSAAPELVEEGVNGAVAESREPAAIAAAVERVLEAGEPLRRSTARWLEANVERLSMKRSIERALRAYGA